MNATRNFLALTLLGFALAAQAETSAPVTVGLHIATAHSSKGFCQNTPGVYAMWANGLTAGVYQNSECEKYSAYIAQTWRTEGRVKFSLTAGAVTGYKAAAVLPLIVPSVAIPLGDHAYMRLSYLAKVQSYGAHALNFAIEKSF